jgi:AMMECR1 domain-containing protein
LKRAWTSNERIGAALIRRARAVVIATLRGTLMPRSTPASRLIPVGIHGVGVTLWGQRMLGCWIGLGSDLDAALARGAALAARDPRYPRIRASQLPTLRIAVSVLYRPHRFRLCRKKRVAPQLRLGLHTLGVASGKHFAMILESAAPHHSLTRLQLTTSLLRKAHLTDRPVSWAAYATATWLEADRGVRRLQCGFCVENFERATPSALQADLERMGRFLMSTLTANEPKWYALNPITGQRVTHGSAEQAGIAYAALWQVGRYLSRRSWQRRALQGLQTICHSRMTIQTRRLIAEASESTARHPIRSDIRIGNRAEVERAFKAADAWVDKQDPSTGSYAAEKEADGLSSRTGCVAIGVAEAWSLAQACGQRRRAQRYARSWSAAMGFARQLIVREVDAPMLREPTLSVGGVRVSKANALISIDAVGDLIVAMIRGLEARRVQARST